MPPATIAGSEVGALHSLPSRLTSFVGRDRELADLERLAKTCRLVTLTGPGGCGKTRLALELATRLAPTYAHGVYVVPLAPLAEPMLVTSTIAEVLGAREVAGEPTFETITRYIGDRPTLLLLDNFEHLLAAGLVVADLLTMCPHLAIVVTSREVLRLQGEQVYPVPPLTLPDRTAAPSTDLDIMSAVLESEAGRLFVERVRSVQPAFSLDPVTASAIAEICARLDGLPLALELAAARVRLLSPRAIVERLEHRLPLLTGGARDLPARQRTLRATVAWSYDLLEEIERVMFRRLAVFVGGWTLEAAASVCRLPGDGLGLDVLSLMESLVDKSLVIRLGDVEGEPRFAMLETIREYALERLAESGEEASVRRRHVVWLADFSRRVRVGMLSPDAGVWCGRLDADFDNLRAAFSWCLTDSEPPSLELGLLMLGSLYGFFEVRYHWTEARRWSEEILALHQERFGDDYDSPARPATHQAPPGQPGNDRAPTSRPGLIGYLGVQPRVIALNGLAMQARVLGDPATATARVQQGIALARTLRDRLGEAHGMAILGKVIFRAGNHHKGVQLGEEALAIFRTLDDPFAIWLGLDTLCLMLVTLGEYERAGPLLEEQLSWARKLRAPWPIGQTLMQLGMLALGQGRLEQAATYFEENLASRAEMGDSHSIHDTLWHLGQVALARDDLPGAAARFGASLAVCSEKWMTWRIPECLEGLAVVEAMTAAPDAPGSATRLQRATHLLGASASWREKLGIALPPPQRPLLERAEATVRAGLGDDDYVAAWAEGRAMTLEQAVEQARVITVSTSPVGPAGDSHRAPSASPAPSATLSRREQEVAALVAEGLSNPQIAARLGLSDRTVDAHLRSIMGKLDVASRAQVAAWIVRHGLAGPPPDGGRPASP
jgi:non-specific serine/threonine protein kinase